MQSALFIGRFQPFHNGHLSVVKDILKTNERVIIIIGSAEQNFISTNPLTAGERFQMIDESLKEAKIPADRYCIIPIRNVNNYALWVNHIDIHVPQYTRIYTGSELVKVCFEKKPGLEIMNLSRKDKLSATKIRKAIVANKNWEKFVPKAVAKRIKEWNIIERMKKIEDFEDLSIYNLHY